MNADVSTCAYYRGVGTCSFGCHSAPECWELGRPSVETFDRWEGKGLRYDPSTKAAALNCERCEQPADHSTVTCCSSHKKVLCHTCYNRTHFVDVCGCSICLAAAVVVALPAGDVAA